MTLPFTRPLTGHCRVINWPNFNTAQGTGRPEEKGRDEEQLVGGAVRTHIHQSSSPSYMAVAHGAPKHLQQ